MNAPGVIHRRVKRVRIEGLSSTRYQLDGDAMGAVPVEIEIRPAALRGLSEVVIHAQMPSEPFFEARGFVREGDPFLDQGVEHVVMRKKLMPSVT